MTETQQPTLLQKPKPLAGKKDYTQLFKKLNLENHTIIQFNVIDGQLTNLLLKKDPRIILGFHNNTHYPLPENSKVFFRRENFETDTFRFLKNTQKLSLVAKPALETLQQIKAVIEYLQIQNVILQIPKTKKRLFTGFKKEFDVGTDIVIKKGF